MRLNQKKLAKNQRSKKWFWLITVVLFLSCLFGLIIWLKPQVGQLINPFIFSEPARQIEEPFAGQLYFNDQLGQNKLSGVVIEAINQAQSIIELAVYSFDDKGIKEAIYQAAARGVKVKIILSAERQLVHQQLFSDLPNNIELIEIVSDSGYMHHKFLLVDRGQLNGQLLFGSYNFTSLQDKYDPSFLLVSQRPELIDSFGQEIDRLVDGNNGQAKTVGKNYLVDRFQYQDGFLEIWFGPQNKSIGLKERMINLIDGTQDNLRAMIWNFTDQDIALAMLRAARRRPVSLLVDDTNWFGDHSVNKIMSKSLFNKLEIITDAKRNQEVQELSGQAELSSFLHHHMLLIDNHIVVFGTNNWSSRGFFKNDESIIISNIKTLVDPFEQSFLFNYEKNK
ncbi:MAG: phospholipase D-like domain-containing protein [Sphaerochaetaceae bacterium]|nr:phospholipase D-like domain-containing protein [Candidatus Paceibacterota bacterium]